MKELLIDVYEVLLNDKYIILSLLKKDNIYVVEKCIIENETVNLIFSENFNTLKEARRKYIMMKATI